MVGRWEPGVTVANGDIEPIVGGVYRLRARNLRFGVWTGHDWVGLREKFGEVFLDESEIPRYTAWPIEHVGTAPEDMVLTAYLGSRCQTCHEPVDFDRNRGETANERWQHVGDEQPDHPARAYAERNKALFDFMTEIERVADEHG